MYCASVYPIWEKILGWSLFLRKPVRAKLVGGNISPRQLVLRLQRVSLCPFAVPILQSFHTELTQLLAYLTWEGLSPWSFPKHLRSKSAILSMYHPVGQGNARTGINRPPGVRHTHTLPRPSSYFPRRLNISVPCWYGVTFPCLLFF